MSTRAAASIAWSASALCVALAVLAVALDFFYTPQVSARHGPNFGVFAVVPLLVYPTVGAFVVSHRPKNLVGWVLCGMGFVFEVPVFADAYADYALAARPGSLPGGELMLWVSSSLIWLPGLFLSAALLVLLFPDGRLLTREWRVVVWLAVGGSAVCALWLATWPGPMAPYHISNPFGIVGVPRTALEVLGRIGAAILLLCCVASVISVFVRLRSAEGEERQQLKWFAYAAAVLLSTFFLGLPIAGLTGAIGAPWAGFLFIIVGLLGIPVSVGIAILKFRLYDIDLLINRTLVYGALTAMLALIYFGGVAATEAIVRALTAQEEQPQLAIVVSTLVIAALFNPLRRRTQSFIDRRFYRRKYDARKTLETFSAKLRDETDLDALTGEVVGVVRETMQPTHVSVWLRPDTASKKDEAPG